MNLENLQKIVKDITQEDINSDILVEIYSAYGGRQLCILNVSELEECLNQETDKQVNVDFFVCKYSE